MNDSSRSPRLVACRVWRRWLKGGAFAETIVNATARRAGLSPADRSLAQAIVYGILRHRLWLEHLLRALRPQGLDDDLSALCLVGLSQIFVMELPAHAAVSETVKLAPERTRGVVNAILRSALRRKREFDAERERLPLSLRFSTPEWLVERWFAQFGREGTFRLLEWNNTPPEIHARANILKPVKEVPHGLTPLADLPGWYRVNGAFPIEAVRQGWFYMADPSTRHSVELLAPRAGERILDACAAPGGKTAAMLAMTDNRAFITATDANTYRVPMIEENLHRLGAKNAAIETCDWERPCPDHWFNRFDAALLDVPCSNTGVIQRRVDVRWRLSPAEITRLAILQGTILENAARAVRPGGRIVYSTCSIDREENEENISRFLAAHADWSFLQERSVLPQDERSDGAYCALLRRNQ